MHDQLVQERAAHRQGVDQPIRRERAGGAVQPHGQHIRVREVNADLEHGGVAWQSAGPTDRQRQLLVPQFRQHSRHRCQQHHYFWR